MNHGRRGIHQVHKIACNSTRDPTWWVRKWRGNKKIKSNSLFNLHALFSKPAAWLSHGTYSCMLALCTRGTEAKTRASTPTRRSILRSSYMPSYVITLAFSLLKPLSFLILYPKGKRIWKFEEVHHVLLSHHSHQGVLLTRCPFSFSVLLSGSFATLRYYLLPGHQVEQAHVISLFLSTIYIMRDVTSWGSFFKGFNTQSF